MPFSWKPGILQGPNLCDLVAKALDRLCPDDIPATAEGPLPSSLEQSLGLELSLHPCTGLKVHLWMEDTHGPLQASQGLPLWEV